AGGGAPGGALGGGGPREKMARRFADGRTQTAQHATGIGVAMDLSDGRLPADLDWDWYLGQARRLIQKVRGYRHPDPALLGEDPLAPAALAAGLWPCPKWAGNSPPPGADTAPPPHLRDCPRYRTAGTLTGPDAGIVVVDVDDPVRWRTWVGRGNSPLLADRWADLDGCLTSAHGATTAEEVRAGRGRGKLIFRLAAPADHPLARMKPGRWAKRLGVDVFFRH